MKPSIGIGISTTSNRNVLAKTLKQWEKYQPKKSSIEVIDDTNFDGISVTKNKLLNKLQDCEHIFLVDDDTMPIGKNWEKSYIESSEPHLMYCFPTSPGHWPIKKIAETDSLTIWDKPRGCFLYIKREVLDVVGGMHHAFGKHGFEHEDWSRRIHEAGLTTYLFADVKDSKIYCLDQDAKVSSVDYSEHKNWQFIDRTKLPSYAEFRERLVPVIVARRYDDGHRDRVWQFLKDNFWSKLPYQIYEGYHTEGRFNRAAGLNKGARLAGNWDVAVFIDSDVWAEPKRIEEGVKLARSSGKLVSVLDRVCELDQQTTLKILSTGLNLWKTDQFKFQKIRTEDTATQSNIVIVPRVLFERVGGFDEQIESWSAEDNCFWKFCELASGKPIRLVGDCYHLWHQPADKSYQPINNRYWQRIKRCTNLNQAWTIRRNAKQWLRY